jgi:hypothetical protein
MKCHQMSQANKFKRDIKLLPIMPYVSTLLHRPTWNMESVWWVVIQNLKTNVCYVTPQSIIMFIIIISFMQGNYTYIPETNYAPRE